MAQVFAFGETLYSEEMLRSASLDEVRNNTKGRDRGSRRLSPDLLHSELIGEARSMRDRLAAEEAGVARIGNLPVRTTREALSSPSSKPNQISPIGIGKPLTVEIAHIYTGDLNARRRVPNDIHESDPDSYFARKRSTLGAGIALTSPGIPMLFITLAILPVLGVELLLDDLVARHVELGIALHLVTAMIWFAFVVEFILLVGVAEKKIAFCRQHWVNIVIIVLPLIAFLRLLRLTRLVRLIRAGKMIRMYRIRGIYARALRVAVLFNLVERILRRNPEGYLRRLETRIAEKEKELASLQEEADEVRAELAEWRAATGERETGRAHSGPA